MSAPLTAADEPMTLAINSHGVSIGHESTQRGSVSAEKSTTTDCDKSSSSRAVYLLWQDVA